MLSNRGLSFIRQSQTGASLPLVRYEDALPVSEFRLREDMAIHDMPGEQLMPFEGSGFSTTWELEFPVAANATGLARLSDVLITFDIRSDYDGGFAPASPPPGTKISRAFFVSALSLDTAGLGTLRGSGASAKVRFRLADLSIAGASALPKITNVAVLLPGIESGTFNAKMRLGGGSAVSFTLKDGIAMSNAAHLSDSVPANVQPLNAVTGKGAVQTIEVEIQKGSSAALLARARDVLLWLEYEHAA
jgi:hypothetical protein